MLGFGIYMLILEVLKVKRNSLYLFNWLLVGMLCFIHPSLAFAQLRFIENKGQLHSDILYEADLFTGKLLLEGQGFSYHFIHPADYTKFQEITHKREAYPEDFRMRYHLVKTRFLGAQKAQIKGESVFPYYYNYFIGRDQSRWARKVGLYGGVYYENLYSGISLRVYSDERGMKTDWIIQPQAEPGAIRIAYEGANDLFLNEGKLYVHTSVNYFVEEPPVAYQIIDGEQCEVVCRYVLKGKELSFELGAYNPEYPLVIDPPIVIFSTYSGTTADNFGFTATYDQHGNLYAGGNITSAYPVEPNGRYPTTPGAYQENPAGFVGNSGPYGGFRCDMAISKYDSSGTTLLWASYLGGTDNDYPHSLVVDNQNRLVILGTSYSRDFPVDTLAFDTSHGGNSDIVVVKFTEDGSNLVGSTFLGGSQDDGILDSTNLIFNFADNYRGDIQVNNNDHILIASCTRSSNGIPVFTNSIQNTRGGGYDGLLVEFDSSLSNVVWSTYWGGSGDDALYSLRIDGENHVICGGGTESAGLKTTPNAFSPSRMGMVDGMLLRVNLDNHALTAATYFGTGVNDQIYFVDFDRKNDIYIFGQTMGFMPRSPGTYGFTGGGQFLVKLNPALDSVIFSTTLGNRTNNPNFSPTAFLVDYCYNIYFAGWGSDAGDIGFIGTTNGLPVTPDAMYPSTDGNDFYLGVLDRDAKNLLYATYYGGTQTSDHVDGGTSRFDKRGVVYHSVCGSCPDLGGPFFISDIPTTPGAAFPVNLSPRCSNASFKIDFQITFAVEADFTVSPKISCAPLSINLTNKSYKGHSYIWDFGDGTTDTSFEPTHSYYQPGKYRIWLKAIDSASCNQVDSVFADVEVIDKTPADFKFNREPCSNYVTFELVEGNPSLGFNWDFGDGTSSTLAKPRHLFQSPGKYKVRLITNPQGTCADTVEKEVDISEPIKGKPNIPNVFTPDGDASNPCFKIDGLLACDEVEVKIVNRWGQLVYETTDPMFCWDGTDMNSGNMLHAGVYYIVARIKIIDEPELNYKGTITMIK